MDEFLDVVRPKHRVARVAKSKELVNREISIRAKHRDKSRSYHGAYGHGWIVGHLSDRGLKNVASLGTCVNEPGNRICRGPTHAVDTCR
jgi:hypothetical protein